MNQEEESRLRKYWSDTGSEQDQLLKEIDRLRLKHTLFKKKAEEIIHDEFCGSDGCHPFHLGLKNE